MNGSDNTGRGRSGVAFLNPFGFFSKPCRKRSLREGENEVKQMESESVVVEKQALSEIPHGEEFEDDRGSRMEDEWIAEDFLYEEWKIAEYLAKQAEK